MKDIQELTSLFQRYLINECSEEETKVLFEALASDEHQSLFLQLIEDGLGANIEEGLRGQPHVRKVLDKARQRIGERIGETQPLKRRAFRGFWFRAVTAAAVLLCVCALTFFFFKTEKGTRKAPPAYTKTSDIGPGGNKAILTLADGSKISLTEAAHGTLANQKGVSITKLADGQIIYTMESSPVSGKAGGDDSESAFNTITTPRGGQYTVVLPDGTRIWLNAASSISYPVKFGETERKVILNGEAYFEVARMSGKKGESRIVPFTVASGNQEVEVLGTHFNVNGYTDEPLVKTTLLEGKVRVSQRDGDNTVLIPGQQARTSRYQKNISVINADIKTELAWKNNQFFFEDEPIKSIMRQISRWYDVDVVYKDDLKDKTVWGSITRFSNISKVLNILELTGNVHFKIEGRTIIVMK